MWLKLIAAAKDSWACLCSMKCLYTILCTKYIKFNEPYAGRIITNIRPTKSLRLILGLIFEINLAEIKLKD